MTQSTPTLENPLDHAATQLRDICRDHEHLTTPFDAGSLSRMLVHINNINHSVLASTRDHINASKRLNDFAQTLDRIARNLAPEDVELATRMTTVAKTLGAAGEELAKTDSVPNWQAPAIRQ